MIRYIDPTTSEVHSCSLSSSVPDGLTFYEMEGGRDKLFREAWEINNSTLEVDLIKAKEIVHDKRRVKRSIDFKPYDDIIALQIPGSDAVAAEAARQVIRDADAILQTTIDGVINEAELYSISITL